MATGEDATTWGEPQTVAGTLLMAQKAFEKAPAEIASYEPSGIAGRDHSSYTPFGPSNVL